MMKVYFQISPPRSIKCPLSVCDRFVLQKYLLFWKFPIYMDKSNRCLQSKRNCIRLYLIPFLKYLFHPNVENKIYDYLEMKVQEEFFFFQILKTLKIRVVGSKSNLILSLPKLICKKFIYLLRNYWFFKYNKRELNYLFLNLLKLGKVIK